MSYKNSITFYPYWGIIIMFCIVNKSDATEFSVKKFLPVDNWGFTDLSWNLVQYSWTISKRALDHREMLESPVFSATETNNQDTWQLELYPNQDKEWMMLYLKRVSGDDRIDVVFQLSLLTIYDEEVNITTMKRSFSNGSIYGTNKFVKSSSITYFTNLTIIAKIYIYQNVTDITGGCDNLLPTNGSHPGGFEMLLEKELYSDAQLKVKGQEFHIHKAILTLVNPTILEKFRLNKGTLNKKSNRYENSFYETDEVDPQIFRKVLRYLYTSKLEDDVDSARAVLPVAMKLDIERLVKLCETAVCRSLNATNALDVLDFAWKHQSKGLEHQARLFIISHASTIVDSPAFKTMETAQPRSFMSVFRKMVEQTKN